MSRKTDERGTVSYCHRCFYVEYEEKHSMTAHRPPSPPSSLSKSLAWSARAQSIWDRTLPLAESLGETYLRHRGCAMPPSDAHLRYLPANKPYPPSLCALVTDIMTGLPISLHFTRLASDGRGKAGTECDKFLLSGHRKRGGCIRLWPDECVQTGLALAEGIETALTAAHAYTPIWASIDCGNLAAFPVLAGIETLVLFVDADDAGMEAAASCGERWNKARRDVAFVMPSKSGTDMNDEVLH